MQSGFWGRGGRVARSGIVVALVAAVAFLGGLAVGNTGSAAAVVARVPFVGDGLSATPDESVDLTDFWKAWNALAANYVKTHASSSLPGTKEKIFGAIQGLADSYGDPYTVFFPPEEAKTFTESISGSFAGVGMEIDIKNGVLTVVAPLKGTPAERAGVKAGDQVLLIDDIATDGMPIEKAISKIRGPAGTVVKLGIVRDGKPVELEITRARIEVPETLETFDRETGVYTIALYEFTANAADLFDRAFENFKQSGARRLVLDLRGNPGGYLDSAVDIASHFLPRGATVVTEDFDGKRPTNTHVSQGYNDLPKGTTVVVLIDGGSASASEILAGALKDHTAATVIGSRSFGKGSVQTLIDLGGGSLKVTVARWVTPAGTWIMGNGVTPTIHVPFTRADAEQDPQMERAVQFLTTGR